MGELASSFSSTEKSVPQKRDYDERIQTGILTSDFEPLFRLPKGFNLSGIGSLYPVTVAQPSPTFTGFPDAWMRMVARYGRACFKERFGVTPNKTV